MVKIVLNLGSFVVAIVHNNFEGKCENNRIIIRLSLWGFAQLIQSQRN